MNRTNISIIAVTAVVVAVILLGSWAVSDDDTGYDGPSAQRDSVVGDVFEYRVYGDDGATDVTVTVMSESASGFQTIEVLYDGVSIYGATDGPFFVADLGDAECVRTETFDSPMYGMVECDVYRADRQYVLTVSGTTAYVGFIESTFGTERTWLLVDSTVLGDEPVFPAATVSDTVSVGDWAAYFVTYIDIMEGDPVAYTDVLYVFDEGGDGTYLFGWLSGGPENAEWVTADHILGVIAPGAELASGKTLSETYLFGTVPQGSHLYETGEDGYETRAFIGTEDGVAYSFTWAYGYEVTLAYLLASSLISGDYLELTGGSRDQVEGDYLMELWYGLDGEGYWSTTAEGIVTGDGYDVYFDRAHSDHVEGDLFYHGDEDASASDAVETLVTAYGEVECYVLTETMDDGTVRTMWIGVEEDVVWRTLYEFEDGTWSVTQILRVTQAEAGPAGHTGSAL